MRALVSLALIGLVSILALSGWPGRDYRHADFFQFWAAPRMVLEGTDPYDRGDWARMYEREAAPPVATPPPPGIHLYPAWNTVLTLPLGAAPLDLAAAAWLVAQLTIVALAVRGLSRVYALDRATTLVLFGLAAASQPVWLMVGGGNTTGFLFGLLVAGLVALVRGRPGSAGVAIALLALKPHPFLIAVPAFLAAARPAERRRLVIAAALTGAALFVITLPFGTAWIAGWIGSVIERAGVAGSNATVWTLDRALPGGSIVPALIASAALGIFLIWWRGTKPTPVTLVAGAIPISLFVAPHGWSYDQLHLFVTYAAVLGVVAVASGARRTALLVATAVLAGPLPWLLYALALSRRGEEWSAVTPLLAFAILAAATSARSGSRLAPIGPQRSDDQGRERELREAVER